MSDALKLCVVGSVNKDLVVRTPRLPLAGETVLGGPFATFGGGKGANQAIAAARLGMHVSMVARVGDDAFGAESRAALESEGVDVREVRTIRDVATGIATIVVEEGGENTIVVAPGANGHLLAADARVNAVADAHWLLAQHEVSPETVAAAVTHARDHGASIALNAAPARPIDDSLARALDVLIVNRSEARELGARDEDALDAARRLRDRGPGCVVVTLGSDGAVAATSDGEFTAPSFEVEARDAVGAGDAFTAAFVTACAEGRGVQDALRFACAAGALATTREGAQPSLPGRAQVDGLAGHR